MRLRRNIGRTRLPAILVAIAAVAAVVAGASSSARGAATVRFPNAVVKQTASQLVVAIGTDSTATDPAVASGASDWQLLSLTNDTLVGLSDNFKAIPEIATSWTQPNTTTYVFTIRQNARFSNGRQLTTADVVGSLQRLIDPKTGSYWASQLGTVKSIAATGPWQVTVTLARPRTSFLAALAHPSASILPMQELKAGSFDPTKELLGTGPYMVTSHTQNQSWTLVRNPYYWQPGSPKIDSIQIQIMPDDQARLAALRSGTVDIAPFDTTDALQLLKGQTNVKSVIQQTTDYYRLDVNGITSIFKDPRLRQALALALNRQQIIKFALDGSGRPSAAASPVFPNGCDAASVPFARTNIAAAKRLVRTAHAVGKTVTIQIYNDPTLVALAQIVQRQLSATGLKAKIVQLDPGEWGKRLVTDKNAPFDISINYFAGYSDPAMVLAWWNPATAVWDQHWLRPDTKLNNLIAQSFSAPINTRKTVIQQTCDRIAQNANIIPLATKVKVIAYRPDKVNATFSPREGTAVFLRHINQMTMK